MAIVDQPQVTTAEQLFEASGLGRCDLVPGELISMPPAGFDRGGVTLDIGSHLRAFVKEHRLGRVVAGDTGFGQKRKRNRVVA